MEQNNGTYLSLIVLSEIPGVKILLFVMFLGIYLVTILMNILLILLRLIDPHLQSPMYFFLSHLSFVDTIFTSTIAPKLLFNLLSEDASISFLGCATQMCIALAMGASESLILGVMAYDRYVAICQPLHYLVLMNERVCLLLVAGCWVFGIIDPFLLTVFIFLGPFHKSKKVRHFYCEIQPVLRLSCDDTHIYEFVLLATTVTLGLCSFLLTLCSYIQIISTILKIHSSEGRSKVFSTCSSHLLVVILLYGTVMSIYMKPISSYTPERDRVISMIYTIGIPVCNPLIYSIRNKEIKRAIRKTIGNTLNLLKM